MFSLKELNLQFKCSHTHTYVTVFLPCPRSWPPFYWCLLTPHWTLLKLLANRVKETSRDRQTERERERKREWAGQTAFNCPQSEAVFHWSQLDVCLRCSSPLWLSPGASLTEPDMTRGGTRDSAKEGGKERESERASAEGAATPTPVVIYLGAALGQRFFFIAAAALRAGQTY